MSKANPTAELIVERISGFTVAAQDMPIEQQFALSLGISRPIITSVLIWMLVVCAEVGGAIPASVKLIPDLAYMPGGDPAEKLDIYEPAKPDHSVRPLIIWVHGGGWNSGSKSGIPFLWLVDQGYVVASLEYRFSRKVHYPAQTQDCQAAVRWLRAHSDEYHFDPAHIGAVGESAGGHLVLMMGMTGGKNTFPMIGPDQDHSDRVQAVCDMYGPADFTDVADQAAHSATPSKYKFNKGDPYSNLLGVPVDSDRTKSDAASPVHYITPNVPPVLIIQGTRDAEVPFQQSQELYDHLKAAGVDAYFQQFPNAGHAGRIFYTAAVHKLELEFFNHYLKGQDVAIELIPDLQVTAPLPATTQATQH